MNYMLIPGLKSKGGTIKVGFTKADPERPRKILSIVCKEYSVTQFDLIGVSRKMHISVPRQVAMWLIRSTTSLHDKGIAKMFNRDRTTIIHSNKMVKNRMHVDVDFRTTVEQIRNKI